MKRWQVYSFGLLAIIFVGIPGAFQHSEYYNYVKELTYDATVFYAGFIFFWNHRKFITAFIVFLLWLNLIYQLLYYIDATLNQTLAALATVAGVIFLIYQKFKRLEDVR